MPRCPASARPRVVTPVPEAPKMWNRMDRCHYRVRCLTAGGGLGGAPRCEAVPPAEPAGPRPRLPLIPGLLPLLHLIDSGLVIGFLAVGGHVEGFLFPGDGL